MIKFGFIGGSGIYDIEGITNTKEVTIETPFGSPSAPYIEGDLNGSQVVFLPRHGKGHTILPNELNHKANIYGMKKLGVTHIISISAVGSLKEELAPRDVVIVDQYFDRTKKGLEHTYFGEGVVGHIAFSDPVCPELKDIAFRAAEKSVIIHNQDDNNSKIHKGGTYINMEGPAFSTQAESKIYKSWGIDVIGMTNLGEARLARESEICYITVAMVTDYDSWHPEHDSVTIDMIIGNLTANATLAKNIIKEIVNMQKDLRQNCGCSTALKSAIFTQPNTINESTKEKLSVIMGKYF